MITKEEIADQLLKACPSFKPVYDESDDDDKELDYIIAGDFARHLLSLFQKGEISQFPDIAEMIENLHKKGDPYTKEFATIGILEGIQNVWGNNGVDPEIFRTFILPVSDQYWQSLNDFWEGKVPYVGYGIG